MTSQTSAEVAPPSPEDQVSLDWLVSQPALGLVPLHLAEEHDEPVQVSWVHAIEVDDPSPWLRPGGLVLTTGLRLPRSRDLQAAYVARLRQAGAAGLGFGTGIRFATVPPGVVEACREQGLSLLEVPLRTPFLAVTQAATDRISQQRRWRVQEVLDAQRALTRAALNGGSPPVVRTLSRLLRSGVHLVDADRVTVATAGDATGEAAETQALGPTSARAGWLTLVRGQPLTPSERLVRNHAVSLVTLDLLHEQVPADDDRASLLAALLGPRGFDPQAVLARVGFATDDPVTLIGLRTADPSRTPTVAGRLRRTLPCVHLHGAGPDGGSDRFLLVPAAEAVEAEAALVRAAEARAQPVTVAIGVPAPLDQVALTLPAVVRALGAQPATSAAHVVRLGDSTGRALLPDAAWSAVEAAAAPWLGLLAAHDQTHATALRTTVATYLTHHGRPDPAARELGIHRHTLRHRLTRAQQVGGFDLDDPGHRALLILALQAPPTASTVAP